MAENVTFYETCTRQTCSPVLAGKGGRCTHSLLELHVGLMKTPVQEGKALESLPVTCLLSISFLWAAAFQGVTNPAATCSYSFILFPPHPLTQNLAKIQEHSASSESPPHCGRAEHRQGENSEEGAWCFHVPNLPCLRLWGWLSLRKQDIRNIPIYELWSQNDLLSFSLPRCGWNQPRNRAFNGKMMAHLSL